MRGLICIFVCLCTTAIRLELVKDCTTESFIAVFHQFTARRGYCSDLFSDNGKYFVVVDRQLRDMFEESSDFAQKCATAMASQRTTWQWSPSSAPHFSGLWGAGVKSTKYHLKRVIGDNVLTYAELSNLLYRIEACLNSARSCL